MTLDELIKENTKWYVSHGELPLADASNLKQFASELVKELLLPENSSSKFNTVNFEKIVNDYIKQKAQEMGINLK